MKLEDYAKKAREFANHDLEPKTAIATWGLGLTGESGEVADIIKKYIGHSHPLDRTSLIKELGDVLWYIAAIADAVEVPFEVIAQQNLEKLRNRYEDKFSTEKSINRRDQT